MLELNTIFELVLNQALKDKELLNTVLEYGGLNAFIDLLINGAKVSSDKDTKLEMLKNSNKLLESKLHEQEYDFKKLLEKYNLNILGIKKTKGCPSIEDLEKEFKIDVDQHGNSVGEIKFPKFIQGEVIVDKVASERIKDNLGIVKSEFNGRDRDCNISVKATSITRNNNGNIEVAVFLDTIIRGQLFSRKTIKGWTRVSVVPTCDLPIEIQSYDDGGVMARND